MSDTQPLPTAKATRHVLLIDDSHADAVLMRRALQKSGMEVNFTWISDAVAALKILLSNKFPHETLIFLDIKMPKISGLDILAKLDEEGKLSCLQNLNIMSSSSLSGDIEAALRYPNVTYYTKPDGYASLRELMIHLLQ